MLKDFRCNRKHCRAVGPSQPSVILGRILVNWFVVRQLIPGVNANDLIRQRNRFPSFVRQSMDEKFFRRFRIINEIKRRVVENFETITTDIVHHLEIIGIAPTFQDAQQESRSVVSPYMCSAAQIKLKFEHFNCNCALLPVICGKVFHGQFHDRMLKIRMVHSAPK